jgi:hypothetical protein
VGLVERPARLIDELAAGRKPKLPSLDGRRPTEKSSRPVEGRSGYPARSPAAFAFSSLLRECRWPLKCLRVGSLDVLDAPCEPIRCRSSAVGASRTGASPSCGISYTSQFHHSCMIGKLTLYLWYSQGVISLEGSGVLGRPG